MGHWNVPLAKHGILQFFLLFAPLQLDAFFKWWIPNILHYLCSGLAQSEASVHEVITRSAALREEIEGMQRHLSHKCHLKISHIPPLPMRILRNLNCGHVDCVQGVVAVLRMQSNCVRKQCFYFKNNLFGHIGTTLLTIASLLMTRK